MESPLKTPRSSWDRKDLPLVDIGEALHVLWLLLACHMETYKHVHAQVCD